MAESKDGRWVTVMGRKVFIKKGQKLSEAMAKTGKFTDEQVGNSEKHGVKRQIQENLDLVESAEPIMSISQKNVTDDFDTALETLETKMKRTKGVVTRDGVKVQVLSRMKPAKAYLKTDAERAAILAVPAVIKKGIEVKGHDDHKERGHSTRTFIGKVKIGGKTGVVAVVIKKTTGNFYKVHRVTDSNGNTLKLKTAD